MPLNVDVEVELRDKGETGMSTIDTPLPPVFYVIVGAGPAAVVNHSTIIRSEYGRVRLNESPAGKLSILHVGFSNPWGRYMKHGMGQPPYLLSLPGFTSGNQPQKGEIHETGGLNSKGFAGAVDDQFKYLLAKQKDKFGKSSKLKPLTWWPWMDGWVAAVQTRKKEPFLQEDIGALKKEFGHGEVLGQLQELMAAEYPNFLNPKIAPYRILTLRKEGEEWKAAFVYAQFIDICTGTGRPRAIVKPDNEKARTPPWLAPASWKSVLGKRRILNGADAICDDVEWKLTDRICVPKGGGIGLNAAEKAVSSNCFLDFFDSKSMVDQTFTNPRNYTFLKHWAEARARKSGEGNTVLTDEELIPHHPKARMGIFAELGKVALVKVKEGTTELEKVEVELKEVTQTAIIRAADRINTAGLIDGGWKSTQQTGEPAPSQNYDFLALPQGLDPAAIGQPSWFAKAAGKPVAITTDTDGRMAALETPDKVIRILGAAALVYPDFGVQTFKPREAQTAPKDRMWNFRTTLPVSAVPDGFILAGINIAKANQYFNDGNKNPNVNTMTLGEIEAALDKMNARVPSIVLANLIVVTRSAANGFADEGDLVKKLKDFVTTSLGGLELIETHEEALKAAFKYAYASEDD